MTPTLVIVLVLAAVWGAAAVVLTVRARPAGHVPAGMAVVLAAGGVASALDGSDSGTGALIGDVIQRLAICLAAAVAFHLLLSVPDGRLPRASVRHAVLAGYAVAAAVGLALSADRSGITGWPVALLWCATASGLPVAHARYRAASAADQRRLQWVGWSFVVAVETALVAYALSLLADWPHHPGAVALAATGLVPVALVAGTVPRLAGRVDRLLTYTVSLTGLTALVVAAYLVALAAFGRRPDGSERSLLLLSMAAAAGAAIAYQPTRVRLAERANRVVYGERVSPDEALRTWGSRLTRAIPLDELLLQLTEALRKSMQLTSAQVWTGTAGHYEVAASVPHRARDPLWIDDKERAVVSRAGVSGGTWLDIWLPGLVPTERTVTTRVAPIAHSGELLGLIVCERPAGAATFTEDDDRVLTELARQVGLALHNVQLDTALQASLQELRETNAELVASRQRIVAAGDAERRKLERNLHDGAQQHLVALAVKLRLAKDAVTDDPDDAEALIDEVRADLQDAIAELRSLAHGIFPPLLMSGGLAEALPAAAARASLATTSDVSAGRFPPEIEAAVYFCCLEALQNAGKHAGSDASACVRVWNDTDRLCWEVTDDGPGFEVDGVANSGHGFVNMRDRMGSFGGSVVVDSAPGHGTRVSGSVPLTQPDVA